MTTTVDPCPSAADSPVPPVVQRLQAAVADLLTADPEMVGQFGLVAGLEAMFEAETTLRAAQTAWLRSAESRDATVEVCGRSPRGWMIEEQMLDAADAGRRLKLARTLAQFPQVEDAFRSARLTAGHATAITSALLTLAPEDRDVVETGLMSLAEDMPPFALTRQVDGLLERLGIYRDDPEARRQRRLAERGLDWDPTFDGAGAVSGTLAPEIYEAGDQALAAAGAYRSEGPEDERTPRQRRHDALGDIFRHYLETADLPTITRERPRIVVTTCGGSLLRPAPHHLALDHPARERWQTTVTDRGRQEQHDGWGRLDSGVPVPPETLVRLACDAEILPVRLDARGDVLDLGRTTRVFSQAIRRASWIRDKGRCAFPRCSRRPVELHHIVWWSLGGRTSLDNAAWLCRFHHWLVHEGSWTMRRDAVRCYVFVSATGREVGHDPPHDPPHDP